MQLNSYNLYAMNTGFAPKVDEVDALRLEIKDSLDFEFVHNAIVRALGEFDGEKVFDYPDLNKSIKVNMGDDKIVFCAAKGGKFVGKPEITWYKNGIDLSEIKLD